MIKGMIQTLTPQKKAFLLSAILHVFVLIILICSFEFSSPMPVVSNNDSQVINAVALQDSPVIAPPTKAIETPALTPPPPKPEAPKPEAAVKPDPQPVPPPVEKKLAVDDHKQKLKKDMTKKLLADLEDEIAKQAKQKQKTLKNKFNQALKAQSEKALQDMMKDTKKADRMGSTGPRSQHMEGVVDKYKALILQSIAQQWVVPSHANKKLACELLIRLAPDGAVLEAAVIKSSGDILLDRSARAAVYKASPLPVPSDNKAFEPFRKFVLKVKPENIMDNANPGFMVG